MSFEVLVDRELIRAKARSVRYLLVRIEAPAQESHDRLPVDVSFVLDRSGSMGGEKITMARKAVGDAIGSLRDADRFSVVAFDDRIDLVVPSTQGTREARREARGVVERLRERGMTDLSGGWLRGCEQIAGSLDDGALGRCLLMSDGLANRGITDRGELVRHAEELRRRGVATSAFGFGRDFDEVLLQEMAQAGGGNFYYVEKASQIPDFLASEVGEALEVVARDVRILVDTRADVLVESMGELPVRRAGGQTTVEIGSLVSEQVYETVLRLEFPEGKIGDEQPIRLILDDRDHAVQRSVFKFELTYQSHARNTRQPRNHEVDRHVARLYAARARAEAVEFNRAGDLSNAQNVLRATAERIEQYAAGDPELLALVAELSDRVQSHAEVYEMAELKSEYAASWHVLQSRDEGGKAMRRQSGDY